jgi:hypothetical protein
MKTRPVGAQLLDVVIRRDGQTDRQTADMTKSIVALCNLSNAPKSLLKFAEEQ